MSSSSSIALHAVKGIPECLVGDSIPDLICTAMRESDLSFAERDVLVIAQKIVSKAEGRYVDLSLVVPSERAVELAEQSEKDPRLVELILQESADVLRVRTGVVVVEHRNGYVHANAGIDSSNIPQHPHNDRVLLLPRDANVSAQKIRDELRAMSGKNLGVVINDSVGRAWRNGTVGLALGSAGICSLLNCNGRPDLYGRPLRATEVAIADQLASAAQLLMGEADEGIPVVLVRGGEFLCEDENADSLIREKSRDMFR